MPLHRNNVHQDFQGASALPKPEARVLEACTEIFRRFGKALPSLALVLGSGFEEVLHGFEIDREVPFENLPHFPTTAVRGHSGKLLLGELEGLPCLICSGRVHFYEGHSMDLVTFPIRVLAACGVRELILTNAAGAINRRYRPGEFMVFKDHINLLGVNPLRGAGLGEDGFVDLSRAYSPELRRELLLAAGRSRLKLHCGIYTGVSGPCYETPAEIRAFRKLGADAVGMSTIPEVVMARACGIDVAAFSCLTNYAAGMSRSRLSHEEVLETGRSNSESALRLFREFALHRTRKERLLLQRKRRKNLKNIKRSVGSIS